MAGAAVRDVADVDGEDRAAGPLDPFDDLGLDGERADKPVEVGDDDHVRLASFDHLDGAAEPGRGSERCPTGDVELLEGVDQLEPVALQVEAIRSRCSAGERTSPSRSPTLLTRTMPMARRGKGDAWGGRRRTGT